MMNQNECNKHIDNIMTALSKYIDNSIESKADQIQIFIDVIIECYSMINYFIRANFEDSEEGIEMLMKELREGFISRNQQIKEKLK